MIWSVSWGSNGNHVTAALADFRKGCAELSETAKSQPAQRRHILHFVSSSIVISAKLCVLCGLFLAILSTAALAQEQANVDAEPTSSGPQIVRLEAGIGGKLKVGYWAPFYVELQAGSEAFQGYVSLVVPDGDGVPSRVTQPETTPLALLAGERKRVELYAKPGRLNETVTVTLHREEDSSGAEALLAKREFQLTSSGAGATLLPSTAPLVLSIGRAGESTQLAGAGDPLLPVDDFADMPSQWYGLEGCDAVLLHTSDARIGQQLRTSPQQLAALDLWVRLGGRLVISIASRAPELLAEDGPLAALVPGRFEAVVPLRQGTALETFADSDAPISNGAPVQLDVAKLVDVRGRIDAFAGSGPRDLPLVVRASHGFGEVVVLTVDLDRQPLADWSERRQFERRLLGQAKATATDDAAGMLGEVTTLGFVDLSGQLRGALDQFPGVRLAPFWLVAVLIAVYIACIGPLDYYLVKHVLKRPAATWATFSLTVLLSSAGALGLAYWLKGNELRVNQLDLVDHDVESGLIRGTSWSSVFSPAIETYDLALEPRQSLAPLDRAGDPQPPGRLLSWFGLSGTGFGGMDVGEGATGGMGAAASSLPLFSEAYNYTPQLDALTQVPIAIWSSKAFVGRWWGTGKGGLVAKLADEGRLTGTLKNTLDVPLSGSVLLYDKWAYVIRDFAPGREIDLELDIDPQTIETYLKRVTAVGDRKVVAKYDQESFDVPRIVEIMTAHDLVGGRTYSGLENRHQQFAELSGHVQRGRAVLIGRVAQPTATLVRAGQPLADAERTQQWTYYRYIIPVSKQ